MTKEKRGRLGLEVLLDQMRQRARHVLRSLIGGRMIIDQLLSMNVI